MLKKCEYFCDGVWEIGFYVGIFRDDDIKPDRLREKDISYPIAVIYDKDLNLLELSPDKVRNIEVF